MQRNVPVVSTLSSNLKERPMKPKTKMLKCSWCGRPQPYGPECQTESGKNVCYECTYAAPCFTRDGKTIYRDRLQEGKAKSQKGKDRV